MGLKEIVSNDYFRLFVKREGKVVLGKNYSSLWLLCSVLTTTFLAIAFSNASLNYLSFKMNDPFINWVDIKNNFGDNDFVGFEQALRDEQNKELFHFSGYQTDKYWYSLFGTSNKNSRNLKCRYFADIQTPLVQAITDEENVVKKACIDFNKLNNESYGVIITEEALCNKLGYDINNIPAYINYFTYCNPDASDFGVEILGDNFAMAPIPVLAVVKRLPTNMDIISTKFLYLQNLGWALNMDRMEYHTSLIYFLPENVDIDKFRSDIEEITSARCSTSFFTLQGADLPMERMVPFRNGSFLLLQFDYPDEVDFMAVKEINYTIFDKYQDSGIYRIYDYVESFSTDDQDDYISVHFSNLDMIVPFQEFAKENFKIDIEMSQINAKENFNEVSIMANILSWTMIVFAIVCIILFIVNLLQSYFQKVKRNLGTFKAFGISNMELISVYVLIMMATIFVAIAISLGIAYLIEVTLPLLGVVKDASFGYLSLWNEKTFVSVLIIIASSVVTVYMVMSKLLKATPGDLIYDR